MTNCEVPKHCLVRCTTRLTGRESRQPTRITKLRTVHHRTRVPTPEILLEPRRHVQKHALHIRHIGHRRKVHSLVEIGCKSKHPVHGLCSGCVETHSLIEAARALEHRVHIGHIAGLQCNWLIECRGPLKHSRHRSQRGRCYKSDRGVEGYCVLKHAVDVEESPASVIDRLVECACTSPSWK